MDTKTWIKAYHEIPVDEFDKSTFRKASRIESNIELNELGDDQDALTELIEIKKEVDEVVTEFLSSINSVFREIDDEFEDNKNSVVENVYRLIGMNIRYMREQRIEREIEQSIDSSGKSNQFGGNASTYRITILRNEMQTMIETLKSAVYDANESFSPEEDQDPKVIYLFTLAKELEYSIRYFQKWMRKNGENGESRPMDFVRMIGTASDTGEITEDMMKDIAESQQNIQEELENAEDQLEDLQ